MQGFVLLSVIGVSITSLAFGWRSTSSLSSRRATLHSELKLAAINDDFFRRPGPWDERDLDSLLAANKVWANKMANENPNFFPDMKKGHAPKILWIGCSDARVPANEIIGEPPGSVFVHRNIANQVINTDMNALSVIQYAVDYLKVKHIVVCGHYECGGCKASMSPTDHKAPLENWVRNIRDVYRLHQRELDSISDITARQRRLVELNAIEQALNLYKVPSVQKRRQETYSLIGSGEHQFEEPQIHAFAYDPFTGLAKKLVTDFSKQLEQMEPIYGVYPLDGPAPPAETAREVPVRTRTVSPAPRSSSYNGLGSASNKYMNVRLYRPSQ